MKKVFTLMACCVVSVFLFTSCFDLLNELFNGKDDEETTDTSTTKKIQNSDGGSLVLNNYQVQMIAGTLPNGVDQSVDPSTTLSIELDAEAPKSIPSFYTLISKIVRFGPEGFVFNYPVSIYFPAKNVSDPTDCAILKYDYFQEEWVQVPITLMKSDPNCLGASVIELGLYALVEHVSTSSMKSVNSSTSEGGCRMGDFTSGVWYSLTVKSVLSLKYAYQSSWYGGNLVGLSASSGTNSTGDSPINPVHMRLPQGQYQIWVSKLVWNRVTGGEWWTYSVPATVNISGPLTWTGSWSSDQDYAYNGWVNISLSGGEYVKGRPEDLPATSATVGTGDFQSTLTWVNSSSSDADLDLHLYGPNDFHIYYANQEPTSSAFNLDIDWRYTYGNAMENIYSVSSIWPTGTYRLVVSFFNGSLPKSYSVRIIRGATSKTVRGTFTSSSTTDNEVYTFTVN